MARIQGKASHLLTWAAEGVWQWIVCYLIFTPGTWAGATATLRHYGAPMTTAFLIGGVLAGPMILAIAFFRAHVKGMKELRLAHSNPGAPGAITGSVHSTVAAATVASQGGVFEQPLTTIKTPGGENQQARALGIPRQFILSPRQMQDDLFYRCTFVVDFVSMSACSASPHSLVLTAPRGDVELCPLKVTVESQTKCPCRVMYEGTVKWKNLRSAIVSTMCPGGVWGSEEGSSPWMMAPERELWCDLEIRFPDRKTKDEHDGSSARLTFELSSPPYKDRLAFRAFVGRYVRQEPQIEWITRLG